GTYSLTTSTLADGAYVITVTATDSAWNTSAASYAAAVRIDISAGGGRPLDGASGEAAKVKYLGGA
ncbi:MAG: hypothetical protein ACRD0O_22725, partial [Acidimicrobiia bacterium]